VDDGVSDRKAEGVDDGRGGRADRSAMLDALAGRIVTQH
jgi:hypothetical protein